MLIPRVYLAAVLLAISLAAWGQSSDQRVCTDLSGKIRVRCPGQESVPAKTQSPAEPAVPLAAEHTQQQSPKAARPAEATVVPVRASRPTESMPADSAALAPVVVRPIVPEHVHSLERSLPENFVADQRNFWTSPLKMQAPDLTYLLPMAAAITAINVADPVIERKLPNGASFIRQSKSFSNYGAAAYAGMIGGAYFWSRATHNDHLRETAILSGEAAINTLAVSEFAKYLAGRSRPLEGDGTGGFRNGGSSFPSVHSADAFAIASVVAHEYPGPLTQLLAYGSASAIAAARVAGRQHFASDVLVGGALGWFIGRQVYRNHSDQEDRGRYGTFERAPREQGPRDPAYMGSPYVPLDSWVYSAIDRLAAMGYIDTAFEGMRPWTRMECARLVREAGASTSDDADEGGIASSLVHALTREFSFENDRLDGGSNVGVSVDSIYARVTGISGTPLTDGYHFGQTIVDDYGRPYQEGINGITGLSSHAVAGPFFAYFDGEYEHSPFAPAEPLSVRQLTASMDRLPVSPAESFDQVNRFRAVEAYAGVNIGDWQLSFGKQSLWWGHGVTTALLMSDNAAPFTMVRASQTTGKQLPGPLRLLGPTRTEFFVGRLGGHDFVWAPPTYRVLVGTYGQPLDPQPYIHGEKFSLKPTPNLDIAVSLTAIWGGQGVPLTASNLFRTYSNTQGPKNNGDRKTGFEFSYKIPGLRRWLTLYNNSIAEDEPNPIAYPRRSAMNPGIFLSHVPFIPKLDFRVESAYTDLPNLRLPGIYYTDVRYVQSYTNDGMLMGSWIGRQARSLQSVSRYWIAPQKTIQFGYRYMHVSDGLIPGGGTLNDFNVAADWALSPSMSVRGWTQFERWNYASLASTGQQNVTVSVEFLMRPKWTLHR